jgi:hypothetical protein
MELRYAPKYGDFTFVYKGISIYVPVSLNNTARLQSNDFWDWLLFKHIFDSHIKLTVEHFIEAEEV